VKSFSPDALAALAAKQVVISGAAEFFFGDTYRLWSGIGALDLPGVGTFDGIGARALIVPIRSEKGEGVDGVRLTLSRLEPKVAATINDEDYRQKPVVIRRLIFNADGNTLLDSDTYFRGRVNSITIRHVARGDCAIDVSVEGASLDMGRSNARVRSNSDQRTLGGSTDGALKNVSVAGERTLAWGQKPARRPLGGTPTGGGSNTGGMFNNVVQN